MDDFNNLFGSENKETEQNENTADVTPEVDEQPVETPVAEETPVDVPAEETVNDVELTEEDFADVPDTNAQQAPFVNTPYGYGAQQQTPPANGGYYMGGNNNGYPYGNNPYPYGNSNNATSYPYARTTENGNAPVPPTGGGNKSSNSKAFKIVGGICAGLLVLLVALVAIIATKGVKPDSTDATSTTNKASSTVDELTTADSDGTDTTQTSSSYTVNGELNPQDVFTKIDPSSVGVLVYDSKGSMSGEGSGVVIQEDKNHKYTYVVTCAHVISGASSVVIQLTNSTQYKADIVGYDSRTDIGVLRIEVSGLTLAEIGDSESLSVGDTVYAIGNPGGTSFANSFTNGMVSAISRSISSSSTGYTMECLQHTAAINPGNSGGALVNTRGQLIGINSSKIVSEDYEGMGFAVPSSVFVDVVNSIIANGYVADRVKLGITYLEASQYENYGMYVAMSDLPAGALVIYQISSDSGLVGTGVQSGDLIIGVNGKQLDTPDVLLSIIENASVGDEITLTIARIDMTKYTHETFDVKVKLVEDKSGTSAEEPTTEENTTSSYSYDDFYRDFYERFYGNGSSDNGSGYYGNYGY